MVRGGFGRNGPPGGRAGSITRTLFRAVGRCDVSLVGARQHVLEEGLVLVVIALQTIELEGLFGKADGLVAQLLDVVVERSLAA